MPELYTIPTFSDTKGDLSVLDKVLPFKIKRVFYIYNVDENIVRGGHRHHKTIQALICIKGSCIIHTNNGSLVEDFALSEPNKCLIVNREDWHTMHTFSEDAILLVLASEHYDVNDYIDEAY